MRSPISLIHVLFILIALLSSSLYAAPTIDGQILPADGYSIQRQIILTATNGSGQQLTDSKLYLHQEGNSLFVGYEISEGFNDLIYGTDAGGLTSVCSGHTFDQLLGSDNVGFTLRNTAGTPVLLDTDLRIDLLAKFNTGLGGVGGTDFYRSSGAVAGPGQTGPGGLDSGGATTTSSKGATDGSGGNNIARADGVGGNALVPVAETSLGRNLLLFPIATTNSNSSGAGWNTQIVYEFELNLNEAPLAGQTFDFTSQLNSIVPTWTHASPACWEATDTPGVAAVPEPSAFLALGMIGLFGAFFQKLRRA